MNRRLAAYIVFERLVGSAFGTQLSAQGLRIGIKQACHGGKIRNGLIVSIVDQATDLPAIAIVVGKFMQVINNV